VAPTVETSSYTDYYRTFARALAGQGDVPVRAEDAAGVIRLVELARESTKLGKTLDV
jgi:predicted dehydrogenase